MTARFRNHFDAAFDSRTQQPGTLVVAEGFAGDSLFDPLDALKHVLDAQQGRARRHLENPRRLGLDLFTNQWMEPVAGGDIDLNAETFFQQSFGCDQIQHAKSSARVVVQEKVDVASGSSLV